jgi:hypothetical protein
MPHAIKVNDLSCSVDVDGDTPPLWVRDALVALWREHGASGWKPDSSCVTPADSIPSSVITTICQAAGNGRAIARIRI